MGTYFNPNNKLFRKSLQSKIYIDKTGLIGFTNGLIDTEGRYMCVSRPRRFGKTMAMNMLAAYYSSGCESSEIFAGRKAAQVTS